MPKSTSGNRSGMDDLDSALDELGMLSSVTTYKLDYLKAVEARAEIRKARERSYSVPVTMKTANCKNEDESDLSVGVNSNFVTNIAIRSSPNMPDLSPYMKRKLQIEIEEKRYRDHRNDLAAFVSPRRSRNLVRSCPYSSPILLRPGLAPVSSSVLVASSSAHRTVGRLGRGPVRFHEPDVARVHNFRSSRSNMYALDEDIMAKLSSIQLIATNQEQENSASQTVKDKIPDLSSLSLSRNS